jgi:hypothetical protein
MTDEWGAVFTTYNSCFSDDYGYGSSNLAIVVILVVALLRFFNGDYADDFSDSCVSSTTSVNFLSQY